MSTFVAVNTYTHSTTYVANNLLLCLKEIVRCSGLDPAKLAGDFSVLERGLAAWLESRHLQAVSLEVYNPTTNALVGRWEFSIAYGWSSDATGSFWVDTDQIKYAILKQGLRVIADTKTGRPDVLGWSSTTYRSTEGFVRQSIGTTMDAHGMGASAVYYRKA
jgi:hypothetical protein